MTRLDVLKHEFADIENMRCLSYSLKEKCKEYYKHEIDCIVNHGSCNPEVPIYFRLTKTAEWKPSDCFVGGFECSNCGWEIESDMDKTNYCPSCGSFIGIIEG